MRFLAGSHDLIHVSHVAIRFANLVASFRQDRRSSKHQVGCVNQEVARLDLVNQTEFIIDLEERTSDCGLDVDAGRIAFIRNAA